MSGASVVTADFVSVMTGADTSRFEERLLPLLDSAYSLAQAMLRDRHEAEDAVQEAMLNAWRKRGQFQDQGRGLKPWFLKIVANQCRSRLRSRWWHVWRRPEVDGGVQVDAGGQVAFRADLTRALDTLNPDQRAALFLYYQLDLPQEEVARILGIGVGTVKSRLHRAVLRLREAMHEELPDDD